ncbi:MAG: type II toxin-antitoxin system PemK/MazF family toxin [Spirulinaceae cyanobacterium RM2_2_10]|nr:type II toxin-antitoxin system PemK/MazF family toxin [Spirulinaceae cyanobacterium RM2_2_10]
MTTDSFGDVLLLPFPFTNQAAVKKRPAVAIGSADYHRVYADVMVMALTSQVSRLVLLGELVVQNWPGAGLLKPSLVKPVVATVQKSLVLRRLGQLQAVDRDALSRVLPTILGL